VKQLKAKPADSTSAVVPSPPPPAETAKVTSPLAVSGSKKGTADAAKSTVGAIAIVSDGISVNAVVNTVTQADCEESLEEEETPSNQSQFLDLNVTIRNSSLAFSSFQKPLNLYLYIPPLSAHPHSCFKGLIKGELNRYWRQNSPVDFQELVTKFLERLHARGHPLEKLYPLFTQAAATLDNPQQPRTNTATNNTQFIHWTHHPRGIQRNYIRQAYTQTLQAQDIHDNLIIAMSRPKNLRDVLTRAKLSLPDGMSIESFISKMSRS
jgi:hypothetical protein